MYQILCKDFLQKKLKSGIKLEMYTLNINTKFSVYTRIHNMQVNDLLKWIYEWIING